MPAGRFLLLETPLAPDAEIELPFEVAHQARDVLRLGVGGTLRLLDGAGGEYPAQVIEVSRKRVLVRLGAREEGLPDPPVRVTLCLGMLKAAKFEVALQKCTELGVAAFVPLLTERARTRRGKRGEAATLAWHPGRGAGAVRRLVAAGVGRSAGVVAGALRPAIRRGRALPLGGDARAIATRRAGGDGLAGWRDRSCARGSPLHRAGGRLLAH